MGIYPIPLPAGYSSVSSSCLYCCVWDDLSVFWKFVEFSEFPRCGRSCTCGLSGFLVTEACVGFLVGGAGFLLSGVQ